MKKENIYMSFCVGLTQLLKSTWGTTSNSVTPKANRFIMFFVVTINYYLVKNHSLTSHVNH